MTILKVEKNFEELKFLTLTLNQSLNKGIIDASGWVISNVSFGFTEGGVLQHQTPSPNDPVGIDLTPTPILAAKLHIFHTRQMTANDNALHLMILRILRANVVKILYPHSTDMLGYLFCPICEGLMGLEEHRKLLGYLSPYIIFPSGPGTRWRKPYHLCQPSLFHAFTYFFLQEHPPFFPPDIVYPGTRIVSQASCPSGHCTVATALPQPSVP